MVEDFYDLSTNFLWLMLQFSNTPILQYFLVDKFAIRNKTLLPTHSDTVKIKMVLKYSLKITRAC